MNLGQNVILARDIANKTPITVHSGTPVHVAASTMVGYNSSYLIVVDTSNDIPVGIVTERDFMKLIAKQKDYHGLAIDAIMSKPLLALEGSSTLVECLEFMKRHGIKHMPLLHEASLEGIITLKTLLMHTNSPVLVQTNPVALYVLHKANGLLLFEYHFKHGQEISGDLFSGALSSFDTLFRVHDMNFKRLTKVGASFAVLHVVIGIFYLQLLMAIL